MEATDPDRGQRTESLPSSAPRRQREDWLRKAAERAAAAVRRGDPALLADLAAELSTAAGELGAGLDDQVLGALAVVEAANRAALVPDGATLPEPGSVASRMLQALVATPLARNRDLAEQLGTDETQISRAGRHLSDMGLIVRFKRGRENRWVVSPRGQAALMQLRSTDGVHILEIDSLVEELLAAPADAARVAAIAADLVGLGIAKRQSTLTRGSLLRPAAARLSHATEMRLLGSVPQAAPEVQAAVIATLGEWGSEDAVAVLSELLRNALPGAIALSLVSALRRLGGLSAAEALCGVIERWQPGDLHELLHSAIDATAELSSGGRADATSSVNSPERSDRWKTNELERAGVLLERLDAAFAAVEQLDDLPRYLRLSATQTRRELRTWARANGIGMPSPGGLVVDSAELAVVLGDAFLAAVGAVASRLSGKAGVRTESSDAIRSELQALFNELLREPERLSQVAMRAVAGEGPADEPAPSPSVGEHGTRLPPRVAPLTQAESEVRDGLLDAALHRAPSSLNTGSSREG